MRGMRKETSTLNPGLLKIVTCPSCGGRLQLVESVSTTVRYGDATWDEVERGVVRCSCGRLYPVEQFVLSFAPLFDAELEREANYWEQFYLWLRNQGCFGFHDLHLGIAPFITSGVAEPMPDFASKLHYRVHEEISEHPLVRTGSKLLDIGVGLGWTSFHFAQRGYHVTAIEPALGVLQAAKRYAIEKGVFIEYICASLGTVAFLPGSFDIITAFHALHHEPNLETALEKARIWLQSGGVLALDEHIGNSKLAASMLSQMHQWAGKEVFPSYKTIGDDELLKLPDEPHSPREDAGAHQIVPLVQKLFDVQLLRTRHVLFDHYPLLYYLRHERDGTAFQHATAIAAQLEQWLCSADPEGGDYATIIALNAGDEAPAGELLGNDVVRPLEDSLSGPAESTPRVLADFSQTPNLQPERASVDGYASHELLARVVQLEKQLVEQGRWARSLEQATLNKDRELARLQGMLVPRWEAALRKRLRSLRILFSNKRKRH